MPSRTKTKSRLEFNGGQEWGFDLDEDWKSTSKVKAYADDKWALLSMHIFLFSFCFVCLFVPCYLFVSRNPMTWNIRPIYSWTFDEYYIMESWLQIRAQIKFQVLFDSSDCHFDFLNDTWSLNCPKQNQHGSTLFFSLSQIFAKILWYLSKLDLQLCLNKIVFSSTKEGWNWTINFYLASSEELFTEQNIMIIFNTSLSA